MLIFVQFRKMSSCVAIRIVSSWLWNIIVHLTFCFVRFSISFFLYDIYLLNVCAIHETTVGAIFMARTSVHLNIHLRIESTLLWKFFSQDADITSASHPFFFLFSWRVSNFFMTCALHHHLQKNKIWVVGSCNTFQ